MLQKLNSALSYAPRTGVLTWKGSRQVATKEGVSGLYVVIEGRALPADKVAWYLCKGEWPKRVYHHNGIKTDNRRCNIESVTPAEEKALDRQREEQRKRDAARARSTLPVGVYQCRNTGLYYARVLVRGHIKVSPRVDTPEQARIMRDAIKLNTQTT